MDVNQIIAEVENEILDLPEETRTALLSWVNQAIREAEDDHNFRYMEVTAFANTVAGTRTLMPLPEHWKEAAEAPFLTFNNGTVYEIDWASSPSDLRRQYNVNDQGRPAFILETQADLQVWPLSDSRSDYPGGEYLVTVPYMTYSAPLDPENPLFLSNWWTSNYPWYVIYKAAAYAFIRNYDTAKGAERAQLAALHFQKAKRKDKRSRLPSRPQMGVSTRAFGPGNRPRMNRFWRRGGL